MATASTDARAWGRRRLLAVVLVAAVIAVAAVLGLVYAVRGALTFAGPPDEADSGTAADVVDVPTGDARRDVIASAPMLEVARQDSSGGVPATAPAPSIAVPAATELGPIEVPTGFPHTDAGAVGQLAAIASTVLQSMSIERTTAVFAAWSAHGAPPVEKWAMTTSVQAFLSSAAGRHVEDPRTSVVTRPVGAQIKGADGQDWVLACVLLDVTVTVVTEARAAYGHCERMQWDDERWVIAPGAFPAAAPSTWPGTDLAAAAGWRTWSTSTAE
jgi:hypothetical protein